MACTHALKLSDSPLAAPALRPAIAIMPLRGVGGVARGCAAGVCRLPVDLCRFVSYVT